MFCKKCGSPLPSKGYICSHCGALMTKEQIDVNKKIELDNKKKGVKPDYLSDQFNVKKNIEFRDKIEFNYGYIIVFVLIIIFLLILLMVF